MPPYPPRRPKARLALRTSVGELRGARHVLPCRGKAGLMSSGIRATEHHTPGMHPVRYIRVFVDRYALVGPIVWQLSVQYFLVQVVVASAWKSSYSWRLNAISDLGATSCGQFDGRYMCSPLHALMNTSFI